MHVNLFCLIYASLILFLLWRSSSFKTRHFLKTRNTFPLIQLQTRLDFLPFYDRCFAYCF